MNIGIIGCGSVAKAHMQALQALGAVYEISVFDPCQENMKAAEAAYGKVTGYGSLAQLLGCGDISGVIIATPNNTHTRVLRDIVAIKNVPVLCEKPLSSSLDEAYQFVGLAPPYSVIGFNYRFNHSVTKSLELMGSRHLGTCHFIDLSFNKNSAIHKTNIGWRDLPDQNRSSGVFGDLSSHLLDLVRYISQSEIDHRSMQTTLGTRVKDRNGVQLENDDHSVTVGATDNGAYFKVTSSKSADDSQLGFHFELTCERGSLSYSSLNPSVIKVHLNDQVKTIAESIAFPQFLLDPESEIPYWADSFYLQDKAWIQQLESQVVMPQLSTVLDGLKVQQLIAGSAQICR